MVRKKVTLGMLATVLAFSLTVAGCGDDNGGPTYLNTLGLSTAPPTAAALAAALSKLVRPPFAPLRLRILA